MALTLTSAAFQDGNPMPRRYTCEGEDLSPPLAWSGAPEATRSFALIVEDPDAPDPAAPTHIWTHWVVYDIPASARALPAGQDGNTLPDGALLGMNDWRRARYGGPCPPVGRHRYIHRLFALDCRLESLRAPTRAQLLRAMQGRILAEAQLIATYQKSESNRRGGRT